MHVFPLVGGTIQTQVSSAFVLVPPTDRIRTGHIQQNLTGHTFLVHKSLLPQALKGHALHRTLCRHVSIPCRKRPTIMELFFEEYVKRWQRQPMARLSLLRKDTEERSTPMGGHIARGRWDAPEAVWRPPSGVSWRRIAVTAALFSDRHKGVRRPH